jgi:hypothetical protein
MKQCQTKRFEKIMQSPFINLPLFDIAVVFSFKQKHYYAFIAKKCNKT